MSELDWIDEEYIKEFINDILKESVRVSKEVIDPNLLKRTQPTSDPNKAHQIIEDIKKQRYSESDSTLYTLPIITSKDYFVLHGHHRWYAHKHLQINIPAYVLSVDYKRFLGIFRSHKNFGLYKKIEHSRDIRIGKIVYSILDDLSRQEEK